MDISDYIRKNLKDTKDFREEDIDLSWQELKTRTGIKGTVAIEKRGFLKAYSTAGSWILAVALLGLFGFFINSRLSSSKTYKSLAPDEKFDTLSLNDGSVAYLKAGTTLSYSNSILKSDSRYFILHGNGEFIVAPDTKSPFIVQCGDITVQALGTIFSIEENDTSILVKCIDHKIAISKVGQSSNIILSAGEQIVYKNKEFIRRETLKTIPIKSDQIIAKSESKQVNDIKNSSSLIRVYYAKDILVFLKNQSKGKIKLVKRSKFDPMSKVHANLTLSLDDIIQQLKDQTPIKSKPGKCKDCISLYVDK